MTDRQVLNLLDKKELISVILETKDKRLMRKINNIVVERYEKELNKILDEQEKCDLTTMKGRVDYSLLEEQYEKLNAIFTDLCGLKEGGRE